MATNAERNTEITTEFALAFNARYIADLTTRLNAIAGLSAVEKTTIINYATAQQPLLSAVSLSVLPEIEAFEQAVEEQELKNESEKREALELARQKVQMDSYDPQNAKEGFKITEPSIVSKVGTTNIPDVDYSPNKKQHFMSVFIDKAKNLIQVNKLTKQIDMLHASGTFLKIDGDGNVTEFIRGNYKRVILGNFATEVRGDTAMYTKGNLFQDTDGNETYVVSGSTTSTSSGDTTINNNVSVTKSVTVTDKVSAKNISASSGVSASGSVNAPVVNAPKLNGKALALQ